MANDGRRERERSARRRLIVSTARDLAEAEGWDAVTTRRLSAEIAYSQPVLYMSFTGMDQIADAVAIDGLAELADVIRAARSDAEAISDALARVVKAYLNFARAHPAVYDAMFARRTMLRFAADDTPPQLMAAFTAMREVVGRAADEQDADALTEVLWAALYGLVTLGRSGRLRPHCDSDRHQLLIRHLFGKRKPSR